MSVSGVGVQDFILWVRAQELSGQLLDEDNRPIGSAGNSEPTPFGPYFVEDWTNPGPGRDIAVGTWRSDPRVWTETTWSMHVSVSTGLQGCSNPPLADDEVLGPNPSMPHSCSTRGKAGDPCDTRTGNFHDSWTDLVVPSRGMGVSFERSYNSSDVAREGAFGFGWSHRFDLHLTKSTDGSTATVVQESGSRVRFVKAGSVWRAPSRVTATLTEQADGSFVFVRRGGADRFELSASGLLLAHEDRNGNRTTMSYLNGKLSSVTDEAGRRLNVNWTGERITSISEAAAPGRSVSYGYDTADDLVSVTDVGGGVWGYGYDTAHRMTWIREPRYAGVAIPPVIENHYDAAGRVDWQEDQLDRRTSFDYTTVPGSTIITFADGDQRLDSYAADGTLSKVTAGYGTAEASTTLFERDPATLAITKTTDPNGHAWTATFDARGNRTSSTDPKIRTTSASYNSLDLPLTITDGEGVTTTFEYDTAGNLRYVRTPLLDATGAVIDTRVIEYRYEDLAHPGDMTSMVDPTGKIWSTTYTTNGDVESVTAPPTPENAAGNETTFSYNAVGWLLSSTSPRGNVAGGLPAEHTTTYLNHDAWGRPREVRDPEWNTATPAAHRELRQWDPNHNLESITDGESHTTTYSYDEANQLTTVQRADSTTISSDYWPDGLLKTQIDAAGQPTGYSYDAQDRLKTSTDPLGRVTTFGYDLSGNLRSEQDPGGNCAAVPAVGCTTMAYDAADQLSSIDYSDATPDVTSIAYDDNGRRTSSIDGSGTQSWVWDSLGRLTSHTDGTAKTVSYGWDLAGRRTKITYPGGQVVTETPDAAGRLDNVVDPVAGALSFGWDPDSNLAAIGFPGSGNEDRYGYDNADQLTSIDYRHAGATTASATYGRNGNRMVDTADLTGLAGADQGFGYDPLNQLTGVDTSTYGYSAANDLTGLLDGSRQEFDAAHQLCFTAPASVSGGDCATPPTGATTFAYDTRGNRVAETHPDGSGTTLGYDQANRLASATIESAAGSTAVVPLTGDWDGDGDDAPGVFDPGDRRFYLRDDLTSGPASRTAVFGTTGDVPIVGDWDGDGDDTIGVYRPSTRAFHVRNVVTSGAAHASAVFGGAGDVPIVGDWDGDGDDTIGVYRPSTRQFFARNDLSSGSPHLDATFGGLGDTPLTGDWDGDGDDTIGVHRADSRNFFSNEFEGGIADDSATYGTSDDDPLTGDWDGDGDDTIGVYWHHTAEFHLRNSFSSGPAHISVVFDPVPATQWTYAYDGDGLRTTKTAPNGTVTTYAWDRSGPLPLLLAETTGGATTRYVYGPGGTPLAQVLPSGDVQYLHRDQLGSTVALTDQSGATLASFAYDPYGNPTAATGTATSRFGFAGEYTDAETGYQYLRARYYDPATGQFLSRDPLVDATREAYGYAGNNPVNMTDPSGLCWPDWACEAAGDAWDATGGKAVSAVDDVSDQDIANFAGGVLNTVTFGNGDTVAGWFGVECNYDKSSGWYLGGEIAGLAVPVGGAGSAVKGGREIHVGSKGARIAPWGNRGPGRFHLPHYHRGRAHPTRPGQNLPDQGLKRHRPWETKPSDTSWRDRF